MEAKKRDKEAAETYAEAATDIAGYLAPADKGWMLAVVIIIMVLQGTEYFQNEHDGLRMQEFLLGVENNRSEEMRRSQETIRSLTQTMQRINEDQSGTIQRGLEKNPDTTKGIQSGK